MFEALPPVPADPILGLSSAFKADPNPAKIDLGVGVYKDPAGHTPILSSVAKAQHLWLQQEDSKTYITPQGVPGFIEHMLTLLLGDASAPVLRQRTAAVQAPGGCGALRILAEVIKRTKGNTRVWVSDPTWANHLPLLGSAGLELTTYPYFDKHTAGINFDAMCTSLRQVQPGDVVLLHGCCHNPTGADLTQAQWQTLLSIAREREFIPFVDIAYQGFGDGLQTDAYGWRLLCDNLPEVILAASCSKNFGLYRERVGLAAIVTQTPAAQAAVQSQIQAIARGIYSMPPAYGGALVNLILADPALRSEWQQEVDAMRTRMLSLRTLLVSKLQEKGASKDFSFINRQKGMFSYLCISGEQVQALRQQHSIYCLDSSRINIAGITSEGVDYLAQALIAVLAN